MPQLEKDYISTGKVKYVARDFPLESIHPQAFKAAEAVHCAGAQGKFWEMHAQLFTHQQALRPEDLVQHAQALGLDPGPFQQCLTSGQYAAAIREDMAEGQTAGITGTPVFFLGLTEPNSPKMKSVKRLIGAQPYASFRDAIESLLAPAH